MQTTSNKKQRTLKTCAHKSCLLDATHIPKLNVVTSPAQPIPTTVVFNVPLCLKHAQEYKPSVDHLSRTEEQIQSVLKYSPYKLERIFWSTIRIGSDAHQKFQQELTKHREEHAAKRAKAQEADDVEDDE